MDWKEAARKSILGEKKNLESIIPDEETLNFWKENDRSWKAYFFQPKKYSVEGKDRVDSVTMKNTQSLPGKLKVSIQKIMKEHENDKDFQDKDILDYLSDEERVELFDSQIESYENAAMMKEIIIEGYGETNLLNKEESIEEFAEEVLAFQNIAQEIVKIITDHNRPLSEEKPKKSTKQSKTDITE